MARGLLQRIERAAAGASGQSQAVSVLDHVQALLNTRQGSSRIDTTYGVPDFTDVLQSLPGGMGVLRAMIEDCIRHHEPRLSSVRVSAVDATAETALLLRFEVHGQLANGGTVHFETEISHGGQVRVR